MADEREKILEEAKRIVSQDRQHTYDHPQRNFARIAEMWSAYAGGTFTPDDVAAMLILMKVARLSSSPWLRDSWVDIAGYAALGGEVRPSEPDARSYTMSDN